jgi:hypothetical protein
MKALICALPIFLGCASAPVHSAEPRIETQLEQQHETLCILENESVTESSGIALSRLAEGVYWTHNDSGDGPNLYAFDSQGRDRGTFTMRGAQAIDWEDIASATLDGNSYLFVGDIGDNNRIRDTIVVYRVPEPKPAAGKHVIDDFETFTLTYPDGAHDCEALIVTPPGEIQLITKSQDGIAGVYQVKLPARSAKLELKKIGELKIEGSVAGMRMVTAADMDGDGKRVVVRTYTQALLYEGSPNNWFTMQPVRIPVPFEGQSEAVSFDFDSGRIITTSEGKPCRVTWTRISKEKSPR